MLQTTDSLGKTTKNYYNALGELYKSVDRQGQATLYTYDARARLTKATAGDIINLTEYYKILFGNAVNFYNAQGQVGSRQNYVDHVPTQGYIYYDAHGDARNVRDGDLNVIAEYQYNLYGKEEKATGTFDNPFRYTGQYYDSESGMYYLRARFYDPDLKRFITEDPIKDGGNWYAYCAGNPVNASDPSGLYSEEIEKALGYWQQQYDEANENYNSAATTKSQKAASKKVMDEVSGYLEKTRQAGEGKVTSQGRHLSVPCFNQYDTFPRNYTNNKCMSTCLAMWISYRLGDNTNRTSNIAANIANNIVKDYKINVPREWFSVSLFNYGVDDQQSQKEGVISEKDLRNCIDNGEPVGCLYGNTYLDSNGEEQWSGHWTLATGYLAVDGCPTLVFSNDPNGGVNRTQTYEEFCGNYPGDDHLWRPLASVAY